MELIIKRDELLKHLDELPVYKHSPAIKEQHIKMINDVNLEEVVSAVNSLTSLSQTHNVATAEILKDPAYISSVMTYERLLNRLSNAAKTVALITLTAVSKTVPEYKGNAELIDEDSIKVVI